MTDTAKARQKPTKIRSAKRNAQVSKCVIFALLVLLSLIILVPFAVVVLTSLKTRGESMAPFSWFFSEGVSIEGYKEVLDPTKVPPLAKAFLNTFIIVIPASVVGLLTSAIYAYAFAKCRF
ncbi:MAG: hypothetical protein LBH24_01070, partial [Clostridiales bacterium]|nr:hypothetical protein [Clostridiales bacterium]